MWPDEGLDVVTDGRPWQWGVAIIITLPLLLLAIPLAVAGRLVSR